jgi:uncharacterized protein (DUF433 family)
VIDPDICNGSPTIEGTRIAVRTILEFLSAGDTVDEVLAEYPTLTRDDVLASIEYSARLMNTRFTIRSVGAVA